MSNENIYLIPESSYEDIVNDRILLYGFVKQLALMAKKAHTPEDIERLKATSASFLEQADILFEAWEDHDFYTVCGDDIPDDDTEGETSFIETMWGLIAKSKAVTADMEAVLAELDGELAPFRSNENND